MTESGEGLKRRGGRRAILWERPRVARCYQRVISIEVRPFSRTIVDTRRQGADVKGLAKHRGWPREAIPLPPFPKGGFLVWRG